LQITGIGEFPTKEEDYNPKNTVSDMSNLSNVKQLSNEVVARAGTCIGFESRIVVVSVFLHMPKRMLQLVLGNRMPTLPMLHKMMTYMSPKMDIPMVLTLMLQISCYFKGKRFIPSKEWLTLSPEICEEKFNTCHTNCIACFSGLIPHTF
jgi:hypothetical protein